MSVFTSSFRYATPQYGEFFNDGRELELFNRIMGLPEDRLAQLRGNPTAILAEIDKFGTEKYLMNVGELKGKLVCDLIAEHRPKVMVEFGGYVGYSTLLFASTLKKHSPGAKHHCIEFNGEFSDIIRGLVSLAGLDDIVTVSQGTAAEAIKRLSHNSEITGIDFLFLDHHKAAYTNDLKICESLNLIHEGTVLVADNVIMPGNPPYLKYVRASVEEKREEAKSGQEVKGNPNLVYESKMIHSFEPSGIPDAIEVTKCLRIFQNA
ncbi:hypothetical protein RUND412_006916 [Rhizina undulata]